MSRSFALPYNTDLSNYHRYEVVKPFQVEESTITPAFRQPGGGTQYRSNVTIGNIFILMNGEAKMTIKPSVVKMRLVSIF